MPTLEANTYVALLAPELLIRVYRKHSTAIWCYVLEAFTVSIAAGEGYTDKELAYQAGLNRCAVELGYSPAGGMN